MQLDDLTSHSSKLQRHVDAIRRNKHTMGHIFLFLCEDPPNASAAREALNELTQEDQIAIWSCSTKAGGVWEVWERHALKTGTLDAPDGGCVWDKGLHYSI